eukprot:gene5101-8271_t
MIQRWCSLATWLALQTLHPANEYLVDAVAPKPHVFLVVADDLVSMKSSASHKVGTISNPSPQVTTTSAASIQTGRYPWGIGYYDMTGDSGHCVDPKFTMLATLLQQQGYSTHAVGKWDVGYVLRECLPTNRGYETFLGYYTACTADYWLHGAPGATSAKGPCNDVDFHNSTVVFTARAVEHIYATAAKNANIERRRNMQRNFAPNHGRNNSVTAKETAEAVTVADEVEVEMEEQQQPLFVALMYHNVHDACMKDRKTTSGLNAPFETVNLYSTTKLDTWKVMGAMVTELDYGMGNLTDALESTGMWANSVIIFVSDNGGPLSHSTNHPLRGGKGSQWEGGVRVEAFVSSPLIPAARRGTTYNGMVHSSDWFGDYKIILNGSATCASFAEPIVSWPAPSTEAVPFGRSSGWVREGTNWAYAGLLNEEGTIADYRAATAAAETGTGTGATVASTAKGDDEGCLFNVVEDLNESNNLRSDRAYANLWKKLVGMLAERGKSGPPLTSAFPLGEVNSTASNKRCAIGNTTGYLFPTDYFS